jgi:UDP-N-acetylmuramoylalanine--D-glutamate ligase
MKKINLKNKKIAVIGLGSSGISAANLLNRLGAYVFVSEIKREEDIVEQIDQLKKGIKYELGLHSEKVLDSELIIKSPGVSNHLPILISARERNIPIWSELELSYRLINKPMKLIAVTGTNGKTTTVTLLGKIFNDTGYKTVVAGNIGRPLSDFVDDIDSDTVVILEISSYQLENIVEFKPDIGCILNITPDHLEHHKTMDEYILSKRNIFINQSESDYCVFNKNDIESYKLSKSCKSKVVYFSYKKKVSNGVYYTDRKFVINLKKFNICYQELTENLKIPGKHNIENVLAAIAISSIFGLEPDKIEKVVNEFTGVEHRIELVREIDGVKYFNDSKSTNVDSTKVALESFDNPIILIMGGRDKGAPYSPLKNLIKNKVKTLLLVGESADKIKHDLFGTTKIIDCIDIKTAVLKAREIASENDIVLLSPGCSSFDQFKNFEHRGKYFKEIVNNL